MSERQKFPETAKAELLKSGVHFGCGKCGNRTGVKEDIQDTWSNGLAQFIWRDKAMIATVLLVLCPVCGAICAAPMFAEPIPMAEQEEPPSTVPRPAKPPATPQQAKPQPAPVSRPLTLEDRLRVLRGEKKL